MSDAENPATPGERRTEEHAITPAAPPGGWPGWFDPASDVMLTPNRLRGLTHPIRVKLLFHLQEDGPATASQLGRLLGHSSGVTSYHLRILADLGFVEEDAGRGNGRDRWWRAIHRLAAFTFRSPDDPGDTETIDLATQYIRMAVDAAHERVIAYVDSLASRAEELPDIPWTLDDLAIALTYDEARELATEVRALVSQYHRERGRKVLPDAAVRAYFQFQMLPDTHHATTPAGEDEGERS